MKTAIIIAIAVGLIAQPTRARLEETKERCAVRYGDPSQCGNGEDGSPSSEKCSYVSGIFQITVYFLNGKAAVLMISKNGRTEFSADELSLFLGANSVNSTWSRTNEHGGPIQEFQRSDGRAFATIVKNDQLVFESIEWRAAKLGMSKF